MTSKWMSMFCKDEKNIIATDVVPKTKLMTDSPSLNWALGGGFYCGYTTVLYGSESSGKSLTSMIAVAALHRSDPEAIACLVSTEMREEPKDRLKNLGIDPERLFIRNANTLHDVFDWVASLDSNFTNSDGTRGGAGLAYALEQGAPIKALLIDSIKGIQGPREQDAISAEKEIMGDLSRFLNPALRKILPVIRKYNLMTIFVQQVNMNMNQDEVKYYNKKYTIPSGQSLKHYAETMALIERVEKKKIFNDEMKGVRKLPIQEGHTIRVKVDKANLDKPFREAEYRIHYSKGVVDQGIEIALLATGLGVIYHPITEKSGKPNKSARTSTRSHDRCLRFG
jgi:RecA/RadA recombinase